MNTFKIAILSIGLLGASISSATTVADFEPVGEMQTYPQYTDLSGGSYHPDWGTIFVDNKQSHIDFIDQTQSDGSIKSCRVGGDLEAVTFTDDGTRMLAVNESRSGVSILNTSDCSVERRFYTDVPRNGGDGIEGIAEKDGIIYLLLERSGPNNSGEVYWIQDLGYDINNSNFDTAPSTYLFTANESYLAGDMAFFGENLVIASDSNPSVLEYTLSGDLVATNGLVNFTNTELVLFRGDEMCVGGEPNQFQCYTANGVVNPPPPPVDPITEECTVTVTIIVNEDGTFEPVTTTPDCPTIVTTATVQNN